MSSRSRHSTAAAATPARSSQRTAAAAAATSTRPRQSTGTALPSYQPQLHPLNDKAQRDLQALTQDSWHTRYAAQIEQAMGILTDNAGNINEALYEKNKALKKMEQLLAASNTDRGTPQSESDVARLQKLQEDCGKMAEEVQRMTKNMERDLQKLIDAKHHHNEIRPALQGIAQETATWIARNTQTQIQTQTQHPRTQQRERRSQRGQQAANPDSDDDELHDFDPTDPANNNASLPSQRQPAPPTGPHARFKTALNASRTRWQATPLRARYAEDNTFRSYKRNVHDAFYGDETAPPLPHESTWFTDEGAGPAPGVTAQAGEGEDSDDDIQIAKTRISTKCPLTLQEFRDPVTSRRCPHSFERAAIEGMIRASGGAGPAARKSVQCPVPGCDKQIALADLHVDAVLKRKIGRIQRLNEEEEEEEEEEGEDGARGRPQSIASGDEDGVMDVDELAGRQSARVKPERSSQAPGRASTRARSSRAVVALND